MAGRAKATLGLLIATVLVSGIVLLTGATEAAANALGVIPARLSGELAVSGAAPAFLTPLTATLVHVDFVHLVMNMLLLAWCGHQVERIIGAGALLLLYAVGAFAAAGAQWLLDPAALMPGIGASGAVSALIGAFAVSFGRAKPLVANLRLNRWLNILWLLAAWVVLQWMMAILMGMQGYLLATGAHVGGFVAGVAMQKPLLLWRYRKA